MTPQEFFRGETYTGMYETLFQILVSQITWDAEENTVCMDGDLYPEMFQHIDDVFCQDPGEQVLWMDNRVRRITMANNVIRDDGSLHMFNNHTDHYCCEANIVFEGGPGWTKPPEIQPYVPARWEVKDAELTAEDEWHDASEEEIVRV